MEVSEHKSAYDTLRKSLNQSATSEQMGLTKHERQLLKTTLGDLRDDENNEVLKAFVIKTTAVDDDGDEKNADKKNASEELEATTTMEKFEVPSLFTKVRK